MSELSAAPLEALLSMPGEKHRVRARVDLTREDCAPGRCDEAPERVIEPALDG